MVMSEFIADGFAKWKLPSLSILPTGLPLRVITPCEIRLLNVRDFARQYGPPQPSNFHMPWNPFRALLVGACRSGAGPAASGKAATAVCAAAAAGGGGTACTGG